MAIKTQAAVLRAVDQPFQIEEIELSDLGPTDVLVKVVSAGVCHTDLGIRGLVGLPFSPTILGHEGAGIVEAVGPAVEAVSVGDHVVISFSYCGHCICCLRGEPAYCTRFMALNTMGEPPSDANQARDASGEPVRIRWFGQSSFSRLALTSERNVVVVDDDVPLDILGPLGCGLQTGAGTVINEMRLAPGQSIAVFGAGGVGLAAVMAAKASGAGEIVVVDLHQSRLDLAADLGATRTLKGDADDLTAQVMGPGPGMDFTFDTTGVGAIITTAISVLAPRGLAALVGGGTDGLALPTYLLAGRKVTFVLEGSSHPHVFIPQMIDLWRRGEFPFDRLIRKYPLEDINQAEADSLSGSTIKPVLIP